MNKPTKRIAIVDAGKNPEFVESILPFISDYYDLEITKDRDADYVFHTCMGNEVLKYSGIRIFVSGEYVTPNFNTCDYALAFDPIEFGDRYCRLPLIKLYRSAYASLCAPRPPANEVLAQKTGFCAYVMSNTKNSASQREALFDALNDYQPIASGGKWRNNVGGPVPDKIAFQAKYKFALAIENYSAPGYLTEKFAQAAQSNCIPIYWGDPTIVQQINPKAFINCHDFESPEALVQHVREIDSNDVAYRAKLAEPWFINGAEPEEWKNATFTNFLRQILDQPLQQAYRRNRSRWGIKYRLNLYRMSHKPIWHACYKLRNLLRGIR